MNQQQLKAKLRADVPDIPRLEEIWDYLKEDGLVDEILENRGLYRDLVDEAEPIAAFQRHRLRREGYIGSAPGPTWGESGRPPTDAPLSLYEVERAAALSTYYGKVAATRPDVRRFRDEVLGGALLAPDEAVQLVTSPAAAVLAADHFGEGRIPLVRHDAEITGERAWREDEWQHRRLTVRVDPPGETISVEWYYDPQARPRRPVVQTLLYIDEEDYIDGARVFRGSLLDGLRRLSETLAGRFPWNEAEASHFVLTGEHPEVPPLTGEVRDGTIRLTVEPFVSAGTVRNFYRQMEIRAGGDAKQDTAKAAAVLRFVLSQVDDEGNRPSWPELQDRWNASHPEWHYTDRGGLRKTYRRAYERIVGPVRSASDPRF